MERAREEAGRDADAVDQLRGVLEDFDLMTAVPGDDMGNIRTSAPILLAKLDDLGNSGFGHHIPAHHHRSMRHLISRFHSLVARNLDMQREIDLINEGSNVIVSTPIDNLAANTLSTQCTWGAPYSGKAFMLCDILIPAELTPAGRFGSLVFAGIDFATPSVNAATVSYIAPAGTLGAPGTQGMGLSFAYTNKTAPSGRRNFSPWTGWYFDPSAKITFTIFNPSLTLPASYFPDWLCRSSPCPDETTTFRNVRGHVRHHQMDHLMDVIHGWTIGMGDDSAPIREGMMPLRAPRVITNGHDMVSARR